MGAPSKSKKEAPKKIGRPRKDLTDIEVVDEQGQDRLDMSQNDKNITVDDITTKWSKTFDSIVDISRSSGKVDISTVTQQWNKLNPFLQNQRIKNLYSHAAQYDKANIAQFLADPSNNEGQLRSLSWANSSSQQIYYNILRRACDIPVYNYFVIPELLDSDSGYNKDDFKNEDGLVQDWIENFNIPNTFKTIALEVKREGKSTYLLRNKFVGQGKTKKTAFATLQKMPTEWVKISGKGRLGYTVSFNMMYFLNIANSPSDFGDFMVQAWESMLSSGVVEEELSGQKRSLNFEKAKDFSFEYEHEIYSTSIESVWEGKQPNYLLWLRMPYDICFTFGSDNSQPWVAPDTMGLMLKLQELTDYGKLAGLIASTPLTAVLTGEIETIQQPRAGKNESVFSPEVIQGMMDRFNAVTSTNVEAWLWPAKNIKLQQLSSDVNSSEIISTATSNFLESAGEGGLTIATEKPNVAQITVAKQLAASQQRYVTLQFEQVLNFIIQNKLGFKYTWKVRIWGDVFNSDNDKKFLKEIVANGNIALLPKLMSAEGISMRDTKAITEYIKTLGFYEDFMTYTQMKAAEIQQAQSEEEDDEEGSVGRPSIDDENVENDATAASKERGDNISDNRE